MALATTTLAAMRSYELDGLFPMEDGLWTGADCASSFLVNTQPAYAVFLFGDTLVGPIDRDRQQRLGPSAMPHSSIATTSPGDVRAALRYVVRRDEEGRPVSLFEPDAAAPWVLPEEYWWTMQGISASRALAEQLGRVPVALVADRILNTAAGSFTVNGSVLLRVADAADADATGWKWDAVPLPSDGSHVSWATAVFAGDAALRPEGDAPIAERYIYLVGRVDSGPSVAPQGAAVLARVLEDALFRAASLADAVEQDLRYLVVAGDGGRRWVPWSQVRSTGPLAPLFADAPPEASVAWYAGLRAALLPAIPFLSADITLQAAQADGLVGGWSPPSLAATVAPPWNATPGFLAYAPKLHPWLSCDALGPVPPPWPPAANTTRLVLSYNINTDTLEGLFQPGRASFEAYVPRFVCVEVQPAVS